MSGKRLERPGHARPPVTDVIGDLLGAKAVPAVPTELPLSELIVVPGFNPRTAALSPAARDALFTREALDELIRSMGEVLEDGQPRGVLQPLLVRPYHAGKFAVVAGERRYHAAQLAGLERVPVLTREMTDREALAAAIIENAQRENIDLVSEALAGFELLSLITGLDHAGVVKHLNAVRQGDEEDRFNLDATLRAVFGTGISTWSQQRAKVLHLLAEERQAIAQGHLNAKQVFPLLRLGQNHDARQTLLRQLLDMDVPPSSREVTDMVERLLHPTPPAPDRSARLRPLLPRLKKLSGEKAAQADRLIEQLQALLD